MVAAGRGACLPYLSKVGADKLKLRQQQARKTISSLPIAGRSLSKFFLPDYTFMKQVLAHARDVPSELAAVRSGAVRF